MPTLQNFGVAKSVLGISSTFQLGAVLTIPVFVSLISILYRRTSLEFKPLECLFYQFT